MLAIVGMVVQSSGIHFPGEAYTNTDVFGAPFTVGWAPNLQIFLGMSAVELSTFNQHYGEGEPGDIGLTGGFLKGKSDAEIKRLKESEIVHCRLAMIAFLGAVHQIVLWGKPFPF